MGTCFGQKFGRSTASLELMTKNGVNMGLEKIVFLVQNRKGEEIDND